MAAESVQFPHVCPSTLFLPSPLLRVAKAGFSLDLSSLNILLWGSWFQRSREKGNVMKVLFPAPRSLQWGKSWEGS